MSFRRARKLGFSLVELVIVVVIIGVITAIAVPRISRASRGAADAAFRESLQSFRTAIEMYTAEHGGTLPGADGLNTTFKDQLQLKTDASGNVGTTPGVHIYGPYPRDRVVLPIGPNAGAKGIRTLTDDPLSLAIDESRGSKGWLLNFETGELIPNTDDTDENGVEYHKY